MISCIRTENISISYGATEIVSGLNLSIPKGKITTIIGPNGCGKSTILKALARVIPTTSGNVYINDKEVRQYHPKELAKIMALLPQGPVAPKGLTVEELVGYGRFPHRQKFGTLTKEDQDMINWALEATNTLVFRHKNIESLSGGQRQRVWIAMALAQKTELLILDEPTTFLDLVHQLDVLQLLQELNRSQQTTIVMVIHELNIAARFADHMIGIKEGKVVCSGTPEEVMAKQPLADLFEIQAEIIQDPQTNKPVCVTYNRNDRGNNG